MALVRWNKATQDPFKELMDLNHQLFGLSLFPVTQGGGSGSAQGMQGGFFPAIDVHETKDHIALKADLPGLRKEDIKVSVDQNMVTIKGERKTEQENKEKNYHRIERTYGTFERSFDLGVRIDANKIKASYKDGVLEVILPKLEPEQCKLIDIDVT